jgi:hypothetical protein
MPSEPTIDRAGRRVSLLFFHKKLASTLIMAIVGILMEAAMLAGRGGAPLRER